MTNKVLVLEFDQLQVNPLLEDQYLNNGYNSHQGEQQDTAMDL